MRLKARSKSQREAIALQDALNRGLILKPGTLLQGRLNCEYHLAEYLQRRAKRKAKSIPQRCLDTVVMRPARWTTRCLATLRRWLRACLVWMPRPEQTVGVETQKR